eukprot:21899-Eustigmatos_ZCMA.PRE.1
MPTEFTKRQRLVPGYSCLGSMDTGLLHSQEGVLTFARSGAVGGGCDFGAACGARIVVGQR